MSEHRCIVCPQLRAGEARPWERAHVCERCRVWARYVLADIVELYALLPTALEPTRSAQTRVSGSRTPPVPLSLSVVDLTLPARVSSVHDPYGDQTGHPGVASTLDSWVRDWRDTLAPDQHLPAGDVVTLTGWFAVRLDDACRDHHAIDEWAAEMRDLRQTLRAALGLQRELPQRVVVPCWACDQFTLYREPGDDRIRCGNPDCRSVRTDDEYRRWVSLVAADLRVVA